MSRATTRVPVRERRVRMGYCVSVLRMSAIGWFKFTSMTSALRLSASGVISGRYLVGRRGGGIWWGGAWGRSDRVTG